MASSNWKSPSASHMQTYGLNPLPEDFEPTEEEEMLLSMYETVKEYERQAARLKDQAARAKLAASEAAFKNNAPKKNKRKRSKKAPSEAAGVEDNENGSESEDYSSDAAEDEDDIHARREAELERLRSEVESAKKAQDTKKQDEDALRAQHLGDNNEDMDIGTISQPSIKKKRVEDFAAEPSSLIANLAAAETPPHDFSKKMDLSVTRGKTLFPLAGGEPHWTPPQGMAHPNEGAFTVELDSFDMARAHNGTGNNTVAIKFFASSESKRFSVNIAAPGHNDFDSVLFHFNPRHHERGGQLVVNNKHDGIWGQSIAIPLSQVPLVFGQTSCTLVIQVNEEGFDIFLENQHCARLEHRHEIPDDADRLILQFPSTDDSLKPENWKVFRVWWGAHPLLASKDNSELSAVAGVNSFNTVHPRKLFVSKLSKIYTDADVEIRCAELERAFAKYGGALGAKVIVPQNATYAFVELESERATDMALAEKSSIYRLNRARRSRHEALQEERAAAQAAKDGAKDGSTWD